MPDPRIFILEAGVRCDRAHVLGGLGAKGEQPESIRLLGAEHQRAELLGRALPARRGNLTRAAAGLRVDAQVADRDRLGRG